MRCIFMTYDNFINTVAYGMEYNFYIDNDEYWISQNSEGFYLTRVRDSYSQEYRTAEELFRYAKIDGKTLQQLWNSIKDNFE
jgi:hypothetical protein